MKIQAWGWLVAGVVALGLNGLYHDGGLDWAHQIADQVQYKADTLLSGRAGQFLAEAQAFAGRNETASARIASAVAEVQSQVAHSQAGIARFEAMTAREQAACARIEAKRARMEAQRARIEARLAAVRIPADVIVPVEIPVDVKVPMVCPHLRISVPRAPLVRAPVRVIQVDAAGAGPV